MKSKAISVHICEGMGSGCSNPLGDVVSISPVDMYHIHKYRTSQSCAVLANRNLDEPDAGSYHNQDVLSWMNHVVHVGFWVVKGRWVRGTTYLCKSANYYRWYSILDQDDLSEVEII